MSATDPFGDIPPFEELSKVRPIAVAKPKPDAPKAQGRPALDWQDLSTKTPPDRRWALKGWFGFGHTTLLVGAGGIGKTLLAQQLASCMAIGNTFIDEVPETIKTLMWACEDDHDELWRRQIAISHWLKSPLESFAENLTIIPRHGLENALVTTEFGRPLYTPMLEELKQQALDLQAQAVILDNAAQLYGGSENDRHAVTMFLNALAGALPGMAILLLAHPARSSGSEFSGSSAWENTARTRLYLGSQLPDQKPDPDNAPQDDVRYLARRKANYSAKDWRKFTYKDGVLVPDESEAQGGMVAHIKSQNAERAIVAGLKRLAEMHLHPTDGATSPRYLPRLMNEYKLTEGFNRAELADAMRKLMLDGRIERGEVGRNEHRSVIVGLRVVAS